MFLGLVRDDNKWVCYGILYLTELLLETHFLSQLVKFEVKFLDWLERKDDT